MDKKKLLQKANLYVLLDKGLIGNRDIEKLTVQLVRGGAEIIQYRDKISEDKEYLENARIVQRITRKAKIPLIINDRLDVAWYLNTEGVHLGQGDLPIKLAKKLLGKEKIIGGSAETVEQAVLAEKEGADYIGVGPMFYTTTKKIKEAKGVKLLKGTLKRVRIPCFAIGGVNLDNLSLILEAGCDKIVVGSAILDSKDIAGTCRKFLDRLETV
jgi:thiamine-phosphate pyrophosphorylase